MVDRLHSISAVRKDQQRAFALTERTVPDLQFRPRFVGFQ